MDKNTNYYQYGYRQYDATIGRWHVVDALAEKYFDSSPYAYVLGNPVSSVDVMGLSQASYNQQFWEEWASTNGGGMNLGPTNEQFYKEQSENWRSSGGGSMGGSIGSNGVKNMQGKFWSSGLGKALMWIAGWKATNHSGGWYQRFVKNGNTNWSWELPLVISPDDFAGNGTGKNCFDNARLQSGKVGVSPEGNPENSFFIYFAGGYESANHGFGGGYRGPNSSNVIEEGADYIINEIYNKRPVTVCVDYMTITINRDGGDHWLTIVSYGIDENNDFYFRFFDNYTSRPEVGTDPLLRFYWNSDVNAFQSRPEAYLFSDEYDRLNGTVYTITAIRRNKKKNN